MQLKNSCQIEIYVLWTFMAAVTASTELIQSIGKVH